MKKKSNKKTKPVITKEDYPKTKELLIELEELLKDKDQYKWG